MADHRYPVVVCPVPEDEGGGFVAFAPDLHGCTGDGDTAEAAMADLNAAVLEWLDEAARLGRDVPAPGCTGDDFDRDMKRIRKLISAQRSMIKEQQESLNSARAQIEALTEQVATFLEGDKKTDKAYLLSWGAAVPGHVAMRPRRRSSRLPN
ncbi:type II toxin-antitoxin system HicB family antitoxin [Pararoseomonas sp. SCSIO 73927]|uniref:type II toxin-antitoxin system HicB family antitoxin n=1 Tax=Pararoseomonas sp. SCSIO 73927 TaxID=3114537 RepID=UPI0030D00F29